MPLAAGAAAPDLRVGGQAVLSGDRPRPTVAAWRTTTVTVTPVTDDVEEVCLRAVTPERSAALGCREVVDGTTSLSVESWPANISGQVTLVATMGPNATDDRPQQRISVLRADDDADGDGLTNRVELESETDLTDADTDGDGLADGPEMTTYGTDPTTRDTDGDGLADGIEVRRHSTDPTAADTDDDGLTDGSEVTTYGTNPTRADTDGDGLADGPEVRRYGTDPTAADTDEDGFADGAEVERYDTDPTQPNEAPGGADGGVAELPVVGAVPATQSTLAAVVLTGLLLVVVAAVSGRALWPDRDGDETTDPDAEERPPGDTDTPAHPDARQVRALLEDNGGRLRQSEIVDRTDWSKSKVSRVVSSMSEADQVHKIRVGRENLVALPGAEPEHATGPFED